MKSIFLLSIVCLFFVETKAQFVATMEVKEPIEGVCNQRGVYALFPMLDGQDEAVCPISMDEILNRLNTEIAFLKENPKHRDKGMIGLVINCKSELVRCEMDIKTKNELLDKQIVFVFNSLGEWEAGKLNGNYVDSNRLFSFKIKKGKIEFD